MSSTPDLAYCTSARKLAVGDNLEDKKILLFVVEVFISELTYILAYKYVAPVSLKYFLRQILGNLLMSCL